MNVTMKYLTKAAELVKEAVDNNSHITIYGDYDLDGLSCLTLWITFLDSLGHTNYTVVKYTKRSHAIDYNVASIAMQNKSDLIIICDTGCSELEHLRFLSGISKVLVLDHHLGNIFESDLDERITIVNPAMWGDGLRMSACCVVYEVAMEYVRNYQAENEDYFRRLLVFYPFLSIYADGAYGRNDYCFNLYQDAQDCLFPPEFNYAKNNYVSTKRFLLFSAAPPINAAFRNGRLDLINKLFLNHVPLPGYERANLIEELESLRNTMRRHINNLSEIVQPTMIGNFALVDLTGYLNQSIPNEIIWNNKGLIANKIADKFKCACVCIVNTGATYTLSVRDYLGRDVLSLMQLFYEVGGHPSAFGGTMTPRQVLDLKSTLERLSNRLTSPQKRKVASLNVLTPEQIEDIALNNEFAHPNEIMLVSVPKTAAKIELTPASWGAQYYQYHIPIGTKTLYVKKEDFDNPNESRILVHVYKGKRLSGHMVEIA